VLGLALQNPSKRLSIKLCSLRYMASRSSFVAFTDETGNSGLNLLDGDQPYFWTGILLTPIDWDELPREIHEACLTRAECTEMHGNQLGLGGIERIAGKLMQLLFRYKAWFLFTRIEKRHLVGTKFVDTLPDSGLNRAVSNFHYGIRFNRLYLAHVLVALLDTDDREEFWAVYAKADAKGFARILRRLEGRIRSRIPDPLTRQLLLDALDWGKANPELLLEGTRSPLDSPNIVALTLLVHELHRINHEGGLTIRTFIHDEQQQFGKHLKTAFEVSKRFSNVDSTSPLAEIINIKETATFDCAFRVASSKVSFGLQVLDVVLWLTKRFVDNPMAVHGACRELAEYVIRYGYISEFTQQSMFREVARRYEVLQNSPVTSEQERKGRELLAELEASRVRRMQTSLACSEENGDSLGA
jgi:hypothetical protein